MDRDILEALFRNAVAAAQPALAIRNNLPAPPAGKTLVIGAGKASAQMAQALEAAWPGPLSGLVVTRYGCGVPCKSIEIVEASHPVPDAAGYLATRRILEKVAGLGPEDLVIALISGGGSALLAAPAPGMTLEDEQSLNRVLLASGAPISAMNAIRKELSSIKGGRLAAAAAPARVATLVVSDIPGDDPSLVASGPTIPSSSTRAQARKLVALHGIVLPPAAEAVLAGDDHPAPMPGNPALARNSVAVIASAALSLEAAARRAQSFGLPAVVLSDAMEGEAREVAYVHAAMAREIHAKGRPFARPVVVLSGGETTVTLRGRGKGGRNAEFLLAFAIAIEGIEGITALAADTDGIDGTEDNAGAFADGTTVARLRAAGIDPAVALADNDAYSAFHAIGDLFTTGPTGTNVNDFRAIIVR